MQQSFLTKTVLAERRKLKKFNMPSTKVLSDNKEQLLVCFGDLLMLIKLEN